MKEETRILLFGATGRMGQEVVASCTRAQQRGVSVEVSLGVSATARNTKIDGISSPVVSEVQTGFSDFDVIIDFSSPEGSVKALEIALAAKKPILICTTGHSKQFEQELEIASEKITIILASNTSIGVNALRALVSQATSMLGDSFDTEIVELHHKMKKDSPSGTALTLARDIQEAQQEVGNSPGLVLGRHGLNLSRQDNELGVAAVRGGDVVGEHTVYFFGDGERIEITHRASKRSIFSDGALKAALWLDRHVKTKGRPGLYSMFDVL